MKNGFANRRNARKASGSTILETGPALLILFMFLFFPLVDCFAMGIAYASCYTLNDLQCREASTLPKTEAEKQNGLIKKELVDRWRHTGLGAFVQVVGTPQTKLTYYGAGIPDQTGTSDDYVEITTTITARPFMTCPFFFAVPGMSAPVTFTISNRRMLENHHFF